MIENPEQMLYEVFADFQHIRGLVYGTGTWMDAKVKCMMDLYNKHYVPKNAELKAQPIGCRPCVLKVVSFFQKLYSEWGGWFDVAFKAPTQHQNCIFIVESNDSYYNGLVLGGKYQGLRGEYPPHQYHGFTVPGIEFAARLWQPSPQPPINSKLPV